LVTVYPNPIGNTGAHFVFSLPKPGTVTFWLYDLRGELVWSGEQEYPAGGNYVYTWPATNNYGADISYGAYYLQARANYKGGDHEKDGKWLTVLR
jgi:flagellar hook assembly protein FlgD